MQPDPDRASFSGFGHEKLIGLILLAITVAVYYPVYGFDFIDLDDDGYVYRNEQVQAGITIEGAAWALRTHTMANWHPVTWFSYMVDSELFGMAPGGFHLTNLAFHLANTLLLFILLRYTTSRLWPSAFVAALFALHPLHVESVAWISERKDVLSTFFWILCTLVYVRYTKNINIVRYCGVVILFILGLAAKPMLVTLPIVFLLLDYWPLQRVPVAYHANFNCPSKAVSFKYLLLEKVPLLIISFLFGLITLVAQAKFSAVQSFEMLPLTTRLANALVSYIGYLTKMVWPVSLTVLYSYPDYIPATTVTIALLLILSVSTFAFLLRQRCPYFIFGWSWYLVTLLPVIGIIQAGNQAMADRYTYVPLIGIFIIMAWGVPDIIAKWNVSKKVLPFTALVLLVTLAIATRNQVHYWQDSVTLFRHTLSLTKDNYLAQNGLALGYEKQGRLDAAIEHYREALRISPGFATARYNLGNVYLELGKIDGAIEQYRLVLKSNPETPYVLNNLGKALVAAGRIPEALQQLRRAVNLMPGNLAFCSNMGVAMVFNGELVAAEKVFKEILRLDPGHNMARQGLQRIEDLRKLKKKSESHLEW